MSLFSRLKVWAKNETVKSADLNAEFDNIISNMVPSSIVGYEQSVSQMRLQTDPGSQGSESQATSEAGEFERLRFVINRALGGTYWYDNPNTSLTAIQAVLNTAAVVPQNRIQSGRIDANNQPMYLTPDTGANSTVKLKAAATNLAAYIKNILVTVSSDLSATLSGPTAFSALINDTTLTAQVSSQTQGENGTVITIDTPSGTPPTVGSYQAWKVVHSAVTEYFLGRYASSTQIDKCSRGYFFDHSDNSVPRIGIADEDTITLCRAAWMFLTNVSNTPALAITYNEPTVSYVQPSSPSSGDWWLDLSTGGIWRTYNGSTFIDGTGTFIGIAVVDGSNVLACRSKFFDKAFSATNTVSLELADTGTIKSTAQGARINVNGNGYQFLTTTLSWASAQLDTGSITSSTTYYLYIADTGRPFISLIAPYNSLGVLLGYYHPSKPWRCVGTFTTDGSSNFQTPTNYDYLGLPANFVDQTRLGVAPISTVSLASPTDVTAITGTKQALTNAYADIVSGLGGSTTLVLNNRPVLIKVALTINNADAGSRSCFLQVLKGATVLRTYKATIGNTGDTYWQINDMFLDNSGGTGSTTYKLQAKFTSGTTITAFPMGISIVNASTSISWEIGIGDGFSTTNGLRALECIEL